MRGDLTTIRIDDLEVIHRSHWASSLQVQRYSERVGLKARQNSLIEEGKSPLSGVLRVWVFEDA